MAGGNNRTFLVFPDIRSKQVNKGVNEGVNVPIEGVNEGVIQLWEFIKNTPGKRTPEIAERIGKGISTIERYLKVLKDNDLIEFKGAPKTGGYYIKEK